MVNTEIANCFDKFCTRSLCSLQESESLEAAGWKKNLDVALNNFFKNKPETKRTCGIELMPVQLSSFGLLCQTSATLFVRITGSYRLVGRERSREAEREIICNEIYYELGWFSAKHGFCFVLELSFEFL